MALVLKNISRHYQKKKRKSGLRKLESNFGFISYLGWRQPETSPSPSPRTRLKMSKGDYEQIEMHRKQILQYTMMLMVFHSIST
jgi:hypothetical protein